MTSLRTVAEFPAGYFLENLAVRADDSILVTALTHKELWHLPPADGHQPAAPGLVHTFGHMCSGIIETYSPGLSIAVPWRSAMMMR